MNEEEISKLALKLAEIGIEIPLDTYILAGVITLVTAGLGTYFGARLKKNGENKEINDNFSNITAQLKETTSIRLKFESYHVKQIESIEGLYEHLITLEKAAKSYINSSNKSDHDFKAAREAAEKFILYSNLNEMWIPSDLYTQINELATSIDTHVYSVLMKVSLNQSQEAPTGLADYLTRFSTPQALDLINNKVPQAKSDIVNKVRKLLDPTNS